jgi:hypothetical protein
MVDPSATALLISWTMWATDRASCATMATCRIFATKTSA